MTDPEIREDELFHWKYLRRERVNGKWRYYYHDDGKKASIGKVDKTRIIKGGNNERYGIVTTQKDGNIEAKVVDKETYKDTDKGYRRFIEDTPLKIIRRENIQMGKKFIDDLITGGVYKKKKK